METVIVTGGGASGLAAAIVMLLRRRSARLHRQELEDKLREEQRERNENELKFHTDFLHEIKTPLTDTVLHVTAHQHGKAAEVDEPEAPAEKELVTPATKEAAALAAKENK